MGGSNEAEGVQGRSQGLRMQLAHPLTTETQDRSHLTISRGWVPPQTVAGDDDVPQSRGQSYHQVVESGVDGRRFPDQRWVLFPDGRRSRGHNKLWGGAVRPFDRLLDFT